MDWIQNNKLLAAALAVFIFAIWTFPQWFAAMWPLFVRDKTLPEWLRERRWGSMKPKTYGWFSLVIGTVLIGLLVVIALSTSKSKTHFGELDTNRRVQIDYLKDKFGTLRNYSVAAADDFSRNSVSNRIVFVTDIPRGPNRFGYIEGKRFVDCAIVGIAVLRPGSDVVIENSTFLGMKGIDSVLIDMPDTGTKFGMVGVQSSSFIGCTFIDIAFAGPEKYLEMLRHTTKEKK